MYNVAMKALAQEQKTILANIKSLLTELETADGAAATVKADESQMGQPPIETPDQIAMRTQKAKEDEKKKEEKNPDEVQKDNVNTPSDVATANDKAEDRIYDALSEVDTANVDEVKKAIDMIKTIQKNRAQKSVDLTPVMKNQTEMLKIMKGIIQDQGEIQTALKNLFDASGITSQMEIAKKSLPENKGPIVSNDNKATIEFLQSIAKSIEGKKSDNSVPEIGNNAELARKSISAALEGGMFNLRPEMFDPNGKEKVR
jgi:hypothetical protein